MAKIDVTFAASGLPVRTKPTNPLIDPQWHSMRGPTFSALSSSEGCRSSKPESLARNLRDPILSALPARAGDCRG